jgi:hypothetical protein
MKNSTGSKHGTATLLLIALCYNLAALAGAVLGSRYYLATPPMLSDRLIMNDLRYGGALCGALISAGLLSLVLARSAIRLTPRNTLPVLLFSTAGLAFVLLQENPHLGTATLTALLIPWLIVLTVSRRLRSRDLYPQSQELAGTSGS